ncbi:MAG: hypothetical protein MUC36_12015 [Planctomycetes bacterium]|nr:hypothetical protein [Planctomycetota bacterium]
MSTPHPILFVTQVPVPADFITIGSTFGNHRGTIDSVARGGDLWIRYPNGTLRNLTGLAGYGNSGFQGASSIAVRDPCVHWSGTRAVFAMVVGATAQQYQHLQYFWRLYEITGLGPNDTPVITLVPNQPSGCNNVSPVYASDGRILFTSDRPRDGSAHLYPPLDEYEVTPIVSGLWSLDPVHGELRLLNHAPSGDFTPLVDSFGRVLFTQWDHLQRDQLADLELVNPIYGMFDWSSEAANSTPLPQVIELFPEPRPSRTDLLAGTAMRGLLFNHFFPWQIHQDGTGLETLNHIGRHELHDYFDFALNGDPNLHDFYVPASTRRSIENCFHLAEDPLQPGRYVGTDAPEFYSHSAGQLVALVAPPGANPDQIVPVHLTHPDTRTQTLAPGPNHSGQYRDPLPLSDGSMLASHTPYTGPAADIGTASAPQSPFTFRLRQLVPSGSYLVAGAALTNGITKTVSWWSPDVMLSYSGPLWELNAVEVKARPVPPVTGDVLPGPEQAAFASAGVEPARLQRFLRERGLALITARDVTSRDRADQQQPFNLRVAGTATQTIGAPGQIYDIAHLQLFQADLLRGRGGVSSPDVGRRVLARPLHDPAAVAAMPLQSSGPAGSVAIGSDGSMAAFVPAQRALSWQLTSPAGTPVVRERYWLTFQPGEIRVCASCHGLNSADQQNQLEPTNTPLALVELLRHWQASTGPVLPAVAAGTVGGPGGTDVLTISGSHGGPGRRVDKDLGQPFALQLAAPPAGPTQAPFVVWARLGVPDAVEQLPSPFGTMLFPPAFLQPADPRLLTLTNGLFADPTALMAASPLPWSVPVPALGFPLVLTLQGALFDASVPAGLSLSNAVILRVQ